MEPTFITCSRDHPAAAMSRKILCLCDGCRSPPGAAGHRAMGGQTSPLARSTGPMSLRRTKTSGRRFGYLGWAALGTASCRWCKAALAGRSILVVSHRLWQDAMLTVREALGSLTPPLKFARAFVCLPTTCLKKSARMLVDLTTLSLPAAFTRFSA